MDKELRKNILEILKDYRARISLYALKDNLIEKYSYENDGVFGSAFSDQVQHVLRVLEGEKLISREKEDEHPILIGIGMDTEFRTYFELTAKGYEEFKPWYKKAWSFLNDDFAKLLSLISILLSIVATAISLHK